jgi:hypothetical protein
MAPSETQPGSVQRLDFRVTVLATHQPAAVAVALAVVSDALKLPVVSPTVDGPAEPNLMRRLIEPGVPVVSNCCPTRFPVCAAGSAVGYDGL